ncbi:hypothetical protein C8Q70DRAFT_315195 [Cubamyces menziesii]|nr:hypothetical protein C8Q70DRAFT_315195 [Cubamyces menziesii]
MGRGHNPVPGRCAGMRPQEDVAKLVWHSAIRGRSFAKQVESRPSIEHRAISGLHHLITAAPFMTAILRAAPFADAEQARQRLILPYAGEGPLWSIIGRVISGRLLAQVLRGWKVRPGQRQTQTLVEEGVAPTVDRSRSWAGATCSQGRAVGSTLGRMGAAVGGTGSGRSRWVFEGFSFWTCGSGMRPDGWTELDSSHAIFEPRTLPRRRNACCCQEATTPTRQLGRRTRPHHTKLQPHPPTSARSNLRSFAPLGSAAAGVCAKPI